MSSEHLFIYLSIYIYLYVQLYVQLRTNVYNYNTTTHVQLPRESHMI